MAQHQAGLIEAPIGDKGYVSRPPVSFLDRSNIQPRDPVQRRDLHIELHRSESLDLAVTMSRRRDKNFSARVCPLFYRQHNPELEIAGDLAKMQA